MSEERIGEEKWWMGWVVGGGEEDSGWAMGWVGGGGEEDGGWAMGWVGEKRGSNPHYFSYYVTIATQLLIELTFC